MRAALAGVLLALAPVLASAADFQTEVAAQLPLVRDAYTFLHQNPELGKQEFKAHDYLLGKLRGLGFTEFVASTRVPTAVIAVLKTGRPGPVIALRSEMDARPLEKGAVEPLTHNPRSAIDGVMHNCGHDAHAAILLGTAALAIKNIDRFSGTIVFLFQPAEEIKGGADDIVDEGILTRLGVQKIFAEHSAPGLPVGTIAMVPGATLAGSNYFTLTLSGRGSHAAAPYDGDDVLLSAMKIAQELSVWPARRIEIANRPMVLSITKFVGDSNASNVLPSTVTMEGTIRAFEDPAVGTNGAPPIAQELKALLDRLSKAYGLTYEWNLRAGSPPTLNDPKVFAEVSAPLALAFAGKIDTTPSKGMFSEDFAYYTKTIPALYMSLGIAKDGLGTGPVHTASFTIHPDAFRYGLSAMSLVGEIETTGQAAWH